MAVHDTFTIRESGDRSILRLNARGVASFETPAPSEGSALVGVLSIFGGFLHSSGL